jgi:hypothetical protein
VGVPWSRSRKGFEAELHLSDGDMDAGRGAADGEELAGTAAAAVESEADTSESKQEEVGGRPRRERKQVERIRSSELRLVTKKTRTGAGPVKAKTQRKTASGSDEDEDEDEDLDVPLAARGSKPAAGLCMLVLAVCVVAKEPKHLSTKPPIGRTSMGDRLDPCTNACRQHACPLALTQCTWLAYFCHRIRRRSLRRASARAMAAVHAHFVCTSTLTSLLSTGRQ